MKTVRTELLEIAFEEGGPADGAAVLLLHGWPDAPCAWEFIASRLQAQGWRTVTPYLRGSGATRFLSEETPRVGAAVALAQDAVDLANVLGVDRFAVIGHDWGARVAYIGGAVSGEDYSSGGIGTGVPATRCIPGPVVRTVEAFLVSVVDVRGRWGAEGAGRPGWVCTWSPEGWFDEAEFARTAESFLNPDWALITLNAYRSRWLAGEAWDARYDAAQRRLGDVEVLSTPTLMIQGAADSCDAASESEGLERYFAGPYRRLLLGGVGHFPHREAPRAVADAILHHLQRRESR